MLDGYEADLQPANERTTPRVCDECQQRTGVVYRGDRYLCLDCGAIKRVAEARLARFERQFIRRMVRDGLQEA